MTVKPQKEVPIVYLCYKYVYFVPPSSFSHSKEHTAADKHLKISTVCFQMQHVHRSCSSACAGESSSQVFELNPAHDCILRIAPIQL